MVDLHSKFEAPESVLFRELEGEAILLDLESGTYYSLDPVGTRMWQLATECDNLHTAFEKLRAEYDVDAVRLREDLIELMQTLASHGLIQQTS